MIPAKTALKIGKDLFKIASLTVSSGRSWQIRVKRDGDKFWLHEGLLEFLEYYSVRYFYNLHFRYEGNSAFHVWICDSSGAEIDYGDSVAVLDTKPPNISLDVCVKEEDVDDVELLDTKPFSELKTGRPNTRCSRKAYQTRRRSYKKKEELENKVEPAKARVLPEENEEEEDVEIIFPRSFFYTKSRRQEHSKETEKAVCAARQYKLKNPSFMVILRSLYQRKVTVPAEFVRRHLIQCSDDVQLQAQNGRRKWPARCFYRDTDGSRTSFKTIGRGWRLFSEDNNLKEGDVCVFELIKKGKRMNVLNVWIYRAADYAGPGRKRHWLKSK